ncbi:hypothetical protein INT46_002546 [Mucor plumbeus]|uniref:Uncharacterized protein n=1 Tax=Mucor plumbeus TaxID=97098 RepID=A0A8H7UVT7_9FUNG|nr:hypothetical protein INT46_002546 [Mucor plumbeus]
MVCPLPVEIQNSIKSLLLQNTPFSVIRKRYPSVSLSTLTRYKKKFLSSATLPAGGRPSFVSVSTQQYIAGMLRNDGGDILQPYQTEPHVEEDGGSVLFWDCIKANGPGYGTTVMDGSLDSTVYVDIL